VTRKRKEFLTFAVTRLLQRLLVRNGAGLNATSKKNSTGVEPRESVRGEIARSFLYMIDRYQLLDHGQRALMLKWNRNDPVSDEEIQRNREIYLLQGIYNK